MPPGSDLKAVQGGEWLQSKVKEIEAMFSDSPSASEHMKQSQLDLVTVNPTYVLGEVLFDKHSGHVGSSADLLLKQMVDPYQYGQPPIMLNNIDIADVARLHIIAARESKLSGRRIFASIGPTTLTEFGFLIRKNFPSFGPTLTFTWPRILVSMIELLPFPNDKILTLRNQIERRRRGLGLDNSLAKELLVSFETTEATVKSGGESFIKLGLAKCQSTKSSLLVVAGCVGIVAAATYIVLRNVPIKK